MTSPFEDGDDAVQPEPVLVRPYVTTEPTPRDPADAPTVIQPAVVDDTETAILDPILDPVPAADPPVRRRRSLRRILALRMLAVLGGVAAALAIAGYMIFVPDDVAVQPSTALPEYSAAAPGKPAPTSAHSSPSARHSRSPSASASSSPSASPSASTTSASDRTGAVTAASGRCLALGGLFGLDGSPILVNTCADVDAQHFTLATDGTLRVGGKCAQSTSDGTVRIAGCADQAGGQWRAGASNSLVNPSTGQCLTDPGSAGATTRVSACTGADDQSWSLP